MWTEDCRLIETKQYCKSVLQSTGSEEISGAHRIFHINFISYFQALLPLATNKYHERIGSQVHVSEQPVSFDRLFSKNTSEFLMISSFHVLGLDAFRLIDFIYTDR